MRVDSDASLLPGRPVRYVSVVMGPDLENAERAFRIGSAGNLVLAGLKLGVGWLAGSASLIADGWHSLSDVGVNVAAWIAHRFSIRAPDDDHHFGHGKLEAFSGLIVGLSLFVAGAAVGLSAWSSEGTLETGWKLWLAFSVAVISTVVNGGLARVAALGARASRSAGLAAIARDNGSDALSSALVAIAILAARSGVEWAEPLATVVIGLLIIAIGWRSVSEGFDVLMDRSDPDLRARLGEVAHGVEGVRAVQSVRVHPLGDHVLVDMEISVDGALTVVEGHEIAHSVESAVTRTHSLVRAVSVHVNPG